MDAISPGALASSASTHTLRLRAKRALSPELNARFERQYRSGGLGPTTFAVFLGLLASLTVYLVAGVASAEEIGWYEGVQAQRVHRIVLISTLLLIIVSFWRRWKERWTVVAYVVLLIIFSMGPISFFLMGDAVENDVVAWRGIASQMICIVLAFTFLRLPLWALVSTALPSSIVVLQMLFDSNEQRLIASSMLVSILVIGIAVWLTIYWRERLLFEQTVVIEAAAETEKQYADLARQERRSLIHDIRQPMSAFAIHMGILRTTQALTPELEKKLSTLGFAFDALKGQVDEFARDSIKADESELVTPTLERLNTIRVVSNTVQLHEPLAASRSIALTAVYRPDVTNCVVRTNLIQLSNVLQLLVGNAIKFSEGSSVRVSCKFDRKNCSIHVTDTGLGIEATNLEKIFDAGFSTGPAGTNSQGLGLFNVRKIVDSLPEHRIRVRSKRGCYTTFKLSLPLATSSREAMNNVRMLIVDDEPSITSGLTTLFEGFGATVVTASSAAQAINLVLEDDLAFELLVCDHDLGSGDNGMALIQLVREHYDTEVPAILVTGRHAQIEQVADSVVLLSKPFDADAILQLAKRCVEHKSASA